VGTEEKLLVYLSVEPNPVAKKKSRSTWAAFNLLTDIIKLAWGQQLAAIFEAAAPMKQADLPSP
jgi:hypothetical protein